MLLHTPSARAADLQSLPLPRLAASYMPPQGSSRSERRATAGLEKGVMLRGGHPHKGLMILDPGAREVIYGPQEFEELGEMMHFQAPPQTRHTIMHQPGLLTETEVILTGWGAPLMDEAFLAAAPKLRAVFHGAGSIRSFTTPAFWRRGIAITCAADANAVPVAEYTLGTILLALRSFWSFAAAVRQGEGWGDHTRRIAGGFRSTVGLISGGVIARKVLARLATFDVHCLLHDPFLGDDEIRALGASPCALPELFQRADVVSLHTPELPETRGLITGEMFASMKEGATFINTARGAVVREREMISLDARGPTGDVREWSFAWRAALYARLHDAEDAHAMFQQEFSERNTCVNLFGLHPPMQMDGNWGCCAAVAEMLVQSHEGEINLLPALPKAWPNGSVKGIRARGGFEVDVTWRDGKLAACTVRSQNGAPCRVRYGDKARAFDIPAGSGQNVSVL